MSGCITGGCGAVHLGEVLHKRKERPGFWSELAIGADLAVRARTPGFAFRAVAADRAYGDQEGFRGELAGTGR
jgi:hypothetical protein